MGESLVLAGGPPAPGAMVSAVLDRPAGAILGLPLLLTHGAGGDAFGAGLQALGQGLARAGHLVVRCNMAYREAGRASPPSAQKSVPGFRAAFEDAQRQVARAGPGPEPALWAVGGKSYGGRVASLAVAEGMAVAALLFYGYPLHPPGRPDALRVDHWPRLAVPCLFLQGTSDPFCDLGLLHQHLSELGGPATVHVVQGGDHSLQVRAASAPDGKPRSAAVVLSGLAPMISQWLADVSRPARQA